jgi:hypothetical protein
MLLLVIVGISGGLATALVVAPFGTAWAILAAPFGGSLCTAFAAAHIARQHSLECRDRSNLDKQTNAMVASLRGFAAQAQQITVEERKLSDCG